MADPLTIAEQTAPTRGDSWPLFKRLVRTYLRPHWPRLSIAIVCMLLAAGAEAAIAFILDPAIRYLFLEKDPVMLTLLPLTVIGIMAVKAGAAYGQSVLMGFVGQRIVADIQINLFSRIMRGDLAWISRIHTGRLISSFINDAMLLRESLTKVVVGFASDLTKVIALAGVMFYQDWQMALIVICVLPPVIAYIRRVGKRMRKASTQGQEETGTLSSLLSESLGGVRTVKAYNQQGREIDRVTQSINRRFGFFFKQIRVSAAASPATEAMTGVAIAGAIYFAGTKALTGEMEINNLVSFIGAMMFALRPLKSLANLNTKLQDGLAAAVRIFALMDTPHSIQDRDDARPLAIDQGAIQFKGVRFAYDDGTEALNHVDLDVPAGKTIALVGPSGGGKSTILNLIPRFYDVTQGAITIDGTDVRDATIESLRASIALVTQEPFLFDDTIASNILYGRPDASQAELEVAAKAAAAHDFIARLPDGYQTVVGEDGLKLSGGQRQRIAIARAMLKDAPILLLDEATSALDTEAERKVQDALKTLMAGRTTLVIAHRLSTIVDADIIYVIENGTVIEQGTHTELLTLDGLYARLYRQSALDDTKLDQSEPLNRTA